MNGKKARKKGGRKGGTERNGGSGIDADKEKESELEVGGCKGERWRTRWSRKNRRNGWEAKQ